MKKTKKFSKGFTLVELLVVIAIIGILAAVVLVSLASQRTKARHSSAMQSIKSAMPNVMACRLQATTTNRLYLDPVVSTAICDSNAVNNTVTAAPGFTGVNWPVLPDGCTYTAATNQDLSAATVANVEIASCGTGYTITCNADNGRCF